jgi:hypothetical protein
MDEMTLAYQGSPAGIFVEMVPAGLPSFDPVVVAPITMYWCSPGNT